MKKIFFTILSFIGILGMTSCSDFTDVKPKGSNLLQTVTDLEMLLNREFQGIKATQQQLLAGDLYPLEQIPAVISRPNATITKIFTTWDEAAHAKEQLDLTQSDAHYSEFYQVIGRIANPILMNIDAAEGDDALRNQVKCEALVLRAYFHYLLVQKFAKAYDPAYASTTLAIPYLKEKQELLETIPQLTLEEVYTNILNDLDEAIGLNGLPEEPINQMRGSLPFAYAVKAMALMAMQRYDEAASAANAVLAINPVVSDYNDYVRDTPSPIMSNNKFPVIHRPFMTCEEDIFVTRDIVGQMGISNEAWERFEDGHICRDRLMNGDMLIPGNTSLGMAYFGMNIKFSYDMDSKWNTFGLKTSQMRLILAECEILNGNIDKAMEQLDMLREKRIVADQYAPLMGTVTTKEEAIKHLKQTSHGENIYTYYNFVERKRWTRMADFKETLTREVDGKTYKLTPESDMWIFPFPQNVLSLNPSIQQNY